jgi:hypothetical protein
MPGAGPTGRFTSLDTNSPAPGWRDRSVRVDAPIRTRLASLPAACGSSRTRGCRVSGRHEARPQWPRKASAMAAVPDIGGGRSGLPRERPRSNEIAAPTPSSPHSCPPSCPRPAAPGHGRRAEGGPPGQGREARLGQEAGEKVAPHRCTGPAPGPRGAAQTFRPIASHQPVGSENPFLPSRPNTVGRNGPPYPAIGGRVTAASGLTHIFPR